MIADGDPQVIQVMIKGVCTKVPDLFGSLGGTIEMLTPELDQDTIKQLALLRWFKEEYISQHPDHSEFLEKLYLNGAHWHMGATLLMKKAREHGFPPDYLFAKGKDYVFKEVA